MERYYETIGTMLNCDIGVEADDSVHQSLDLSEIEQFQEDFQQLADQVREYLPPAAALRLRAMVRELPTALNNIQLTAVDAGLAQGMADGLHLGVYHATVRILGGGMNLPAPSPFLRAALGHDLISGPAGMVAGEMLASGAGSGRSPTTRKVPGPAINVTPDQVRMEIGCRLNGRIRSLASLADGTRTRLAAALNGAMVFKVGDIGDFNRPAVHLTLMQSDAALAAVLWHQRHQLSELLSCPLIRVAAVEVLGVDPPAQQPKAATATGDDEVAAARDCGREGERELVAELGALHKAGDWLGIISREADATDPMLPAEDAAWCRHRLAVAYRILDRGQGDTLAAAHYAREALALGGPHHPGRQRFLANAATVFAWAQVWEQAEAYLTDLWHMDAAGSLDSDVQALAHNVAGYIAWSTGERDAAVSHYRQSFEGWKAAGCQRDATANGLDLAKVLVQTGHVEEGEQLLPQVADYAPEFFEDGEFGNPPYLLVMAHIDLIRQNFEAAAEAAEGVRADLAPHDGKPSPDRVLYVDATLVLAEALRAMGRSPRDIAPLLEEARAVLTPGYYHTALRRLEALERWLVEVATS